MMSTPATDTLCFVCTKEDATIQCCSCDLVFCVGCDERFHIFSSRRLHDREAFLSPPEKCDCCGVEKPDHYCEVCHELKFLCSSCDERVHTHQDRRRHTRKAIIDPMLSLSSNVHCSHCHEICHLSCNQCIQCFCSECDDRYHKHPNRAGHVREELTRMCNICDDAVAIIRCDECNSWYCAICDGARHQKKTHDRENIWKSKLLTTENVGKLQDAINHEKEALITKEAMFQETIDHMKQEFELQKTALEDERRICINATQLLQKIDHNLQIELPEITKQINEITMILNQQLSTPKDSISLKQRITNSTTRGQCYPNNQRITYATTPGQCYPKFQRDSSKYFNATYDDGD